MFGWFERLLSTFGGSRADIAIGVMEEFVNNVRSPGDSAVEACAGVWGRAFASSIVSASPRYMQDAITPSLLNQIGRELLLYGESLWLIDFEGRSMGLYPIGSYTIEGGPDVTTWRYSHMSISGPSETRHDSSYPSDRVLHFRINHSQIQPWQGRSPLAIGARVVADQLESYLRSELALNNKQAFITPGTKHKAAEEDIQSAKIDNAKQALGIGNTISSYTRGTPDMYKRIKFGPELTQSVVELRNEVEKSIISAAGIPPGLILGGEAGTATREDLRRLFALTIQPISRIVQQEFRDKLGNTVTIDSAVEAREADAASKARAFQSKSQAAATLVGLGVDVERALRMVELEVNDG